MRLVDANALLDLIWRSSRSAIQDAIYNAPTIEAERIRHGHWIEDRSIGDCCYKCSNCGFIRDAYLLEIGNYCPQCGAKMDGEIQWDETSWCRHHSNNTSL